MVDRRLEQAQQVSSTELLRRPVPARGADRLAGFESSSRVVVADTAEPSTHPPSSTASTTPTRTRRNQLDRVSSA